MCFEFSTIKDTGKKGNEFTFEKESDELKFISQIFFQIQKILWMKRKGIETYIAGNTFV